GRPPLATTGATGEVRAPATTRGSGAPARPGFGAGFLRLGNRSVPRCAFPLQSELRRVGCLTGSADGSWNADSRRALESFNKFSGTQLDAKVASIDALDAVRLKQSRVCPLECERGYQAEGERCIRVACQSGYVHDDDGDCVRVRERAARHRSIAEEAGSTVPFDVDSLPPPDV
ncbi:MAG: hypothetical protein WCF49_00515, partial [Xanthobacteraceae bacterium]